MKIYGMRIALSALFMGVTILSGSVSAEFEFSQPPLTEIDGFGYPFFVKYGQAHYSPTSIDYAIFEDGTLIKGVYGYTPGPLDEDQPKYFIAGLSEQQVQNVKSALEAEGILIDPGYNPKEGPFVSDLGFRHTISYHNGEEYICLRSYHEAYEQRGDDYYWGGNGPARIDPADKEAILKAESSDYQRFREAWEAVNDVASSIMAEVESDFEPITITYRIRYRQVPTPAE